MRYANGWTWIRLIGLVAALDTLIYVLLIAHGENCQSFPWFIWLLISTIPTVVVAPPFVVEYPPPLGVRSE